VVPCHREEGAITNVEPTVRYTQSPLLASAGPPENLNQLIDLAHFGEGFLRPRPCVARTWRDGNADRSSGNCRGHLTAADKFEQSAASKASL